MARNQSARSSDTGPRDDMPEPTSPRMRAHRKGRMTLAKPIALLAAVTLVVLAALVLFPGAGGDPEAFDASTDAAPGAAEPLDQIEGQGAEPDGQGGLLEPGLRETEGQIVED